MRAGAVIVVEATSFDEPLDRHQRNDPIFHKYDRRHSEQDTTIGFGECLDHRSTIQL